MTLSLHVKQRMVSLSFVPRFQEAVLAQKFGGALAGHRWRPTEPDGHSPFKVTGSRFSYALDFAAPDFA